MAGPEEHSNKGMPIRPRDNCCAHLSFRTTNEFMVADDCGEAGDEPPKIKILLVDPVIPLIEPVHMQRGSQEHAKTCDREDKQAWPGETETDTSFRKPCGWVDEGHRS